ncbi:uncharacterized protein VTP21DRAFT_5258 [Calcarisporiella thermophila]|uniref:uncharacterized protein n=1 Tax=Calcarisporiella thermophila TaxID=911321 RepID=UPI0037430C1B
MALLTPQTHPSHYMPSYESKYFQQRFSCCYFPLQLLKMKNESCQQQVCSCKPCATNELVDCCDECCPLTKGEGPYARNLPHQPSSQASSSGGASMPRTPPHRISLPPLNFGKSGLKRLPPGTTLPPIPDLLSVPQPPFNQRVRLAVGGRPSGVPAPSFPFSRDASVGGASGANDSSNYSRAGTDRHAYSTHYGSRNSSISEEAAQPSSSQVRCQWTTCTAEFFHLEDLVIHLCKLHVSRQPYGSRCRWSSCNVEKPENDELLLHLCRDHLGTDLQLTCRWAGCTRLFQTFEQLTLHICSDHIGSGLSEYYCQWEACERRSRPFYQRQKILRHIKTHTGDRPYQCSVCNKRFSEPNVRAQHMRTHTGEKPYKCPMEGCHRSFSIKAALTIHYRVHSGERPFICNFEGCERRFAESSNLKKHSRIHTGERPFRCKEVGCDKRFSRSDQATRHWKTHQRL